jgi:Ca2+-binding RTX toxin-like protein
MDLMVNRASAAGGSRLLTIACAIVLVSAVPAGAATSYPAGGSSFDGGAQGWTGSDAACSMLSGVALLCETTNAHHAGGGNPGGAIATDVSVTANLLGLFQGSGAWTSPRFAVPAGAQVTGATLQLDRRFDAGGLVSLSPQSEVIVELVNESAGSTAQLLTETLDEGDSAFGTRGAGVPSAAISPGADYHLRVTTTTSSGTQSLNLVGEASTAFDNVSLTLATAGGGGAAGLGAATPVLTPGVTIVRGPLSDSEIARLMSRFSEWTEVGSGPGGSAVPLAECTIVGTPGSDRVVGTRGNDVICGLGGNDVIGGGGGRDLVDGGDGADRLGGGPAGDLLLGLRGGDRVTGHPGADRAGGGAGGDRVAGGPGRDRTVGGSGRDRVLGGTGADRIAGGRGPDRIAARDWTRDRVRGGAGRDVAGVDRAASFARRSTARRRADRVRGVERLR